MHSTFTNPELHPISNLFGISHLSCGTSCVTLMSMLEVQILCDSPDNLDVDAEHIHSDEDKLSCIWWWLVGKLLGKRQSKILERRLKRLKEKSPGFNVCGDGPVVLELTRDHRPDRADEKLRIEAAGGFVESYGGLPRVNGQLAVSRSIGDLAFKK